MSESVLIRPQFTDEDTVEIRREPYRPAKPTRRGPGYLLRQLAGLDEAILDWVPEERHRYTRLGAIVLNTGLMAALSMLALLSSHDVPIAALIPAALVWGYIIVTFDSWLVSNTHGTAGLNTGTFLVRLAISVLMGLVVAEPLLLWTFKSDVDTQINKDRTSVVANFGTTLKRCNPLSGAAPSDATDCTREFLLNVAGNPQPLRDSLTTTETEREKIKTAIAAINTERTRREDLARRECNGTTGTGLSGRVGEGPNCRRLRTEADDYLRTSGLAQRQAELNAINTKIADLEVQVTDASTGYSAAVTTAIEEKVAGKKGDFESPGLLARVKALDALGAENVFVLIQAWLLRLLLIVVDCLPVLTKKMSRATTYDALLSRQLTVDSRLHDKHMKRRAEVEIGDLDVRIKENEHNIRVRMEAIEEAGRAAEADRQAGLDEQIEELARRLRGD